jgi:hypothetical protein
MNALDAAYHVVHDYPGGAESLGPRLKKGSTVLSAEVAGRGTAKFGLSDAVKVTQMTGDYRILHAFAEAVGQMCIPLPGCLADTGDDVLLALGETSREFSELCREVCQDVATGVFTDNALDRFELERGKLMADLHHLGEAFRAKNLAAKPAFIRSEGGVR